MFLLVRMAAVCTRLLALVVFSVVTVGNAEAKENEICCRYDGKTLTKDELSRVLADHREWLDVHGANPLSPEARKDGRRANLCGVEVNRATSLSKADLRWADLREAKLSFAYLIQADLRGADLRKAILVGADLRWADLSEANLSEANLIKAYLGKADLRKADLRKAILVGADLRKANLSEANLRGAWLLDANVSHARLEPDPLELEQVTGLVGVKGLSNIQITRINNVLALRKMSKDAGYKTEEKALTSAMRKYYLLFSSPLENLTWSILLGGFLTDFGAEPLGPFGILVALVFVFVWPYLWAIWKARDESGIWRILPEDRLLRAENEPDKELVRWRGMWRSVELALYFSFLSAFHFGWRELNIANWVMRVQKREYVLRATGWVRTVSGIQSLISLYLVVLWLLAYFGDLYA